MAPVAKPEAVLSRERTVARETVSLETVFSRTVVLEKDCCSAERGGFVVIAREEGKKW